MPIFTVTIERHAFQEIDLAEIEAATPEEASILAESEYIKYARDPESVWDVRQVDYEHKVGKVRMTEG